MCNENNGNNNCIAEILEVILLLQRNTDCGESCLESCDRGFLGCGNSSCSCNTRPIMLYTCGNGSTAFAMPISKAFNEETTSTVFRIEKLDCNCATFRVLTPNTDDATNQLQPFITTNSFFTINLNCVCAIRCLQDTYIDCI